MTDDPPSSLTFLKREISHLPVDQRGHRHLHLGGPLNASQGGFVNDGEEHWFDRVDIWSGAFACHWCDAYPGFRVITDAAGQPVSIAAATECTLPRGMTFTVDLEVPSGRVIVSDVLSPVLDLPLRYEADVPGYNSIAGQALYCAEMAAIGCAYGPVGDTSPGLIRVGEDRYVIASFDDEAEPGEDGYFEGEHLAHISTGVHAYSIADFDHFLAKAREWVADPANTEENDGGQFGIREWITSGADPTALPRKVSLVDITPGTYRFTHHSGEFDFENREWPVVIADIEKIA